MARGAYDLGKLEACLPTGPLSSIKEVCEVDKQVSAGLVSANLKPVIPFEWAYDSVTERADFAYDNGLAQEPEILQHSVVNFKWLYHKQLWALCARNNKDIDMQWRPLLLYMDKRRVPTGILTLMGMCAHVRADLVKLVAEGDMNERYYQHDYKMMVGGYIKQVAEEGRQAYVPNLYGLGRFATNKTVDRIASWRDTSYFDGERIKYAREHGLPAEKIVSLAERRAYATNVALGGFGVAAAPFTPPRAMAMAA